MQNLFEANLANAADTEISITDTDGEVIEKLYSFNKIFDTFLKKVVDPRHPTATVKTWFTSNFKNWMKNGGIGYEDHGKYLAAASFHKFIFPDFKQTVADLADEFTEMSDAAIIATFPEYIQRASTSVEIFAGGRLFRLNKLAPFILELVDYLNAVDGQAAGNRDLLLMPDAYYVKDLRKLTPVEAARKAVEYHEYFKRVSEKITEDQIKTDFKRLELEKDYTVFADLGNGLRILQAKTAAFVSLEGKAMKHCVGTYHRSVEDGTVVILSLNDSGIPRATFEMRRDVKTIVQLKGPHNSTVQPKYHEVLKKFIIDNEMVFGNCNDYKLIGLKSASDVDPKKNDRDLEESFFKRFADLLVENDDGEKKRKPPITKTKPVNVDPLNFSRDDKLPAKSSRADMTLNQADAEDTAKKISGVKMDFKSFLHFANMDLTGLEDAISEIDITKPTPSLLPKVINTALLAAGTVEPKWHMVRNLPGYMSAGIRAIGRQIFAPFTSTKIEEIQVIANLNDSGPNSSLEINSVTKFLKDHGTRNSQAEIKFTERIPGYEASILLYTFANYSFLLVKDHAGGYIYAWPSVDNRTSLKDSSLDKIQLN